MLSNSRNAGKAEAGHNFSIGGRVIILLSKLGDKIDNLLLLFC